MNKNQEKKNKANKEKDKANKKAKSKTIKMSIIQHRFFPRSTFDYDIWNRPLTVASVLGPSTLDLFDPFDALDHSLCRNLLWIDQPEFLRKLLAPSSPRVPHKYRIAVDCAGFNPKSIKTELSDDKSKLVVSAKEGEEKANEDGDFSVKQFRRTYKLPENVEVDKMVSFVTGEGRLVVEFPIKREEKKADVDGLSMVAEENGKKVVKVNFDVPANVDPSKITVSCKDRDLIVQAEDKTEKPDGVSQFYYYRRTTLPENTDFNAIKCTLDSNKLMIEAPFNPDLKPNQRVIPIEMKQQQASVQNNEEKK